MKAHIRTGVAASLGMLLLILDTKTALMGAKDGLDLCIKTAIPALLPFIFFSMLLTGALTGSKAWFLRLLGKLLRMPAGSEVLFLIGCLGGYPTGAQAVSAAYERGQLPAADAKRLLGFCSNAGPSFLFGITALQFSDTMSPWLLWLIHLTSAVLTGVLLPGRSGYSVHLHGVTPITAFQSLRKSIVTMAQICCWIILFRIGIAFLSRWFLWLLPNENSIVLYGLLELTIGCTSLEEIACIGMRFVICAVLLGFGGICVLMQTASCVGKLGLGMYVPGKALQCSISLFLAAVAQQLIYPPEIRWQIPGYLYAVMPISIAFGVFLLHKCEKRDSISCAVGV